MKSILKNGNWVLDVIQHEIERSASFDDGGRCNGGNLDWNYFLWMRNRTFHWRSKRDKMRTICFDTFLFMNGVRCPGTFYIKTTKDIVNYYAAFSTWSPACVSATPSIFSLFLFWNHLDFESPLLRRLFCCCFRAHPK